MIPLNVGTHLICLKNISNSVMYLYHDGPLETVSYIRLDLSALGDSYTQQIGNVTFTMCQGAHPI